jgi:hypothetical protein
MGQAESPADQPTAGKYLLDLFRCGAGSHVKILGDLSQQEITNAATDDKRLVA